MSLPPLNLGNPVVEPNRVVAREFHIWLQGLARAADGLPGSIDEAPGSFTIASTQHAIFVKRLRMTGTQRATLQGSARLVGCG